MQQFILPARLNEADLVAAAPDKTGSAAQTYKPVAWHMHLQAAILFLMVATAPVLPRPNIAFLLLLAVLALADLFLLNRGARSASRTPYNLPLAGVTALLVAYLFINALWARETDTALGKAALVGLIAGSVYVIGLSFGRQSGSMLRAAEKAVAWGALIGIAFALFEYASDHLLRRSLFELWPAIRSESNAVSIFIREGGELVPLPPSEYGKAHANEVIQIYTDGLNRNLSLVLLYLWPILAIIVRRGEVIQSRTWFVLLLGMTALTVFISASQTAQIALVAGLGVYLLARALPDIVHWILVTAWCIALVFTLPLASAPYKAGLHEADWLFASAKDRIAIWSLTSELARKSPILGVGIRSTRHIGRDMRDAPETAATYAKPRRLGIHAHNHFLQTWFELGAVGAGLILAWGILLLWRMRALAGTLKPFAYAAFATASAIAMFGWGLWQTWLLTGFGATLALFQLSAREPGREK